MASYITNFRRFSALLEWNDKALAAQFYKGLCEPIKDELARAGHPEELITRATEIDNRLYERRLEHNETTASLVLDLMSPC